VSVEFAHNLFDYFFRLF